MNLSPAVICLLVLIVAAGCNFPGKPDPADRPVPVDQVLDFNLLYGKRCAGCHGADGNLGPAPPLNDPLFLAIVPDKELHRVITEGRFATPGVKSPMPAFAQHQGGTLTAAQVQVLADGIKKRWKAVAPVPASLPSYWGSVTKPPSQTVPEKHATVAPPPLREDDLVRTAAQMQESRLKLFSRACASCHGSQGQGGKDGDQAIGAINNQPFLTLISDQALRRIIITGRPDLGMPAFDGKQGRPIDYQPLTSAEIDQLVSLLAHWRQSTSTPK